MVRSTILINTILLISGISFAGLVPNTWDAQWGDTSALTENSWDWNEAELDWDVSETFGAVAPASFSCGATTASTDPIITITKTIENGSDFAWTSFVLEVDSSGGAAYVANSATVLSGNHLNNISENINGIAVITFDSPVPVQPTEIFEISFEVQIPASTSFTLDIEQTPVPEPASLSLLGLGAAFLARRKR